MTTDNPRLSADVQFEIIDEGGAEPTAPQTPVIEPAPTGHETPAVKKPLVKGVFDRDQQGLTLAQRTRFNQLVQSGIEPKVARQLAVVLAKSYDPSQPRNDKGEWDGDGGGAGRGSEGSAGGAVTATPPAKESLKPTRGSKGGAGRAKPANGKPATVKEVAQAVRSYKNFGYHEINQAAKNYDSAKPKGAQQKQDRRAAEALSQQIEKSPLEKDTTMYRGLGLPPGLKVGDSLESHGFTSASANKSVASKFANASKGGADKQAVMATIRVPAGTKALNISKFFTEHGGDQKDGEREFLFGHQTRFRIAEDNGVKNGVRQLTLEPYDPGAAVTKMLQNALAKSGAKPLGAAYARARRLKDEKGGGDDDTRRRVNEYLRGKGHAAVAKGGPGSGPRPGGGKKIITNGEIKALEAQVPMRESMALGFVSSKLGDQSPKGTVELHEKHAEIHDKLVRAHEAIGNTRGQDRHKERAAFHRDAAAKLKSVRKGGPGSGPQPGSGGGLHEKVLRQLKQTAREAREAGDHKRADALRDKAAALAASTLASVNKGEWDESSHPRDRDGRFGESSGGETAAGATQGYDPNIHYQVAAEYRRKAAALPADKGSDAEKLAIRANERELLAEREMRTGRYENRHDQRSADHTKAAKNAAKDGRNKEAEELKVRAAEQRKMAKEARENPKRAGRPPKTGDGGALNLISEGNRVRKSGPFARTVKSYAAEFVAGAKKVLPRTYFNQLHDGARARSGGKASGMSRRAAGDEERSALMARLAALRAELATVTAQLQKSAPVAQEVAVDAPIALTPKEAKRRKRLSEQLVDQALEAVKSAPPAGSERVAVQVAARVVKAAQPAWKRIVHSVVYSPGDVDAHGDFMEPEDIEKMAHDAMRSGLYVNHEHQAGAIEADIVESYIAPQDFNLQLDDGSPYHIPKGSHVMAMHVWGDEPWQRVLSGEYAGFSLEGTALREVA